MINDLHELLTKRQLTVATAESCTGGLLAAALSSQSGSSQYFLGSVVSYANAVKLGVLGVPVPILSQNGAVSREVAEAMVEGLHKTIASDIGIAITGIAGPSGGSPDKPVGTVWIALRLPDATLHAEKFQFNGNRDDIRSLTVQKSIALLIHHIMRDNSDATKHY